jgi:hypothetical protein
MSKSTRAAHVATGFKAVTGLVLCQVEQRSAKLDMLSIPISQKPTPTRHLRQTTWLLCRERQHDRSAPVRSGASRQIPATAEHCKRIWQTGALVGSRGAGSCPMPCWPDRIDGDRPSTPRDCPPSQSNAALWRATGSRWPSPPLSEVRDRFNCKAIPALNNMQVRELARCDSHWRLAQAELAGLKWQVIGPDWLMHWGNHQFSDKRGCADTDACLCGNSPRCPMAHFYPAVEKAVYLHELQGGSQAKHVIRAWTEFPNAGRPHTDFASYCQIWCLRFVGHAAIWSGLVVSIPSLNVTPVMTLARQSKPRSFRQFCSAHCPSLNIMCSMPSRDRQPFDRLVRWRIVAKADSIGLLVRMLCQCRAGTSKNAMSSVRSFCRHSAALGYLGS